MLFPAIILFIGGDQRAHIGLQVRGLADRLNRRHQTIPEDGEMRGRAGQHPTVVSVVVSFPLPRVISRYSHPRDRQPWANSTVGGADKRWGAPSSLGVPGGRLLWWHRGVGRESCDTGSHVTRRPATAGNRPDREHGDACGILLIHWTEQHYIATISGGLAITALVIVETRPKKESAWKTGIQSCDSRITPAESRTLIRSIDEGSYGIPYDRQ